MKVGDKLQVEIADIDERGKISLIPVDDTKSDAQSDAPADDKDKASADA